MRNIGIGNPGNGSHGVSNQLGNLQKPNPLLQEQRHCTLIGRVEDGRQVASLSHGFHGQCQPGKGVRIRLFKGQLRQTIKVQSLTGQWLSLGIVQGILDGQPHIRRAQLGNHRSVHILHHGMNHTLGVNHHLNLIQIDIKKPLCFHDLQPLVDQRG